jgi:hypothetical protein
VAVVAVSSVVLLLAGAVPLALAWSATRGRTLRGPLAWASAAWAAWLMVLGKEALGCDVTDRTGPYLALALTGCAGVAVLGARRPGAWLAFRDGYGFLWAQHQREQFNRAALHAGYAVELGWIGLRRRPNTEPPSRAALCDLLQATLKRFGRCDSCQ